MKLFLLKGGGRKIKAFKAKPSVRRGWKAAGLLGKRRAVEG